MRSRRSLEALTISVLLSLPAIAAAQQQKTDIGRWEYDTHCAVCHGLKGKGDGPYAGSSKQPIADLTTLAKTNNGVFPFRRVYESIDGTTAVAAHGPRDMPIWGRDYSTIAAELYPGAPYVPEGFIRGRILALTEYVFRLQEK
jgi:mono/diheme cytochrome c family protein